MQQCIFFCDGVGCLVLFIFRPLFQKYIVFRKTWIQYYEGYGKIKSLNGELVIDVVTEVNPI
jgi:hypothetical protein